MRSIHLPILHKHLLLRTTRIIKLLCLRRNEILLGKRHKDRTSNQFRIEFESVHLIKHVHEILQPMHMHITTEGPAARGIGCHSSEESGYDIHGYRRCSFRKRGFPTRGQWQTSPGFHANIDLSRIHDDGGNSFLLGYGAGYLVSAETDSEGCNLGFIDVLAGVKVIHDRRDDVLPLGCSEEIILEKRETLSRSVEEEDVETSSYGGCAAEEVTFFFDRVVAAVHNDRLS